MTSRALTLSVLATLLPVSLAAQGGQGANARTDGSATPPRRPGTLAVSPRTAPPPESSLSTVLLVYPIVQTPPEAGPVYQPGNGVTAPILLKRTDPQYTEEARRAGIAGEVWLDAIVEPGGRLSSVKVVKSLDTGLDQKSIEAAGLWSFMPGLKDRQPVRVQIQIIMEFRLGAAAAAQSQPSPSEFGKGAYKPGEPGLVVPVLKRKTDPIYSSAAMRAKIQGAVKIEAVIQPDGTVGETRIVESLDQTFGLDENALAALKNWTFEPAQLNGRPVPALVMLIMEFRLH